MRRKKRTLDDVIAELTLMDDPFMTTVFSDNIPAVQLVLQIILGRDDLTVVRVRTQQTLENLRGHSLRLDILAEDSKGKQYNIEIQNDSSGATLQRARYHSALLDAYLLPAGKDAWELPETYVIFISRWDVLADGFPIYHIDRVIRESGVAAGDGTHIIFVNGSCQDGTELGKLMQDFHNSNPEHMNYEVLRDEVRHYKSGEKGRVKMCAALDEYMLDRRIEARAEGKAEGKAEGIAEGKIVGIEEGKLVGKAEGIEEGKIVGIAEGKAVGQREAVIMLLKYGAITPEQAAMASSLSLEEAIELAASLKQ